MKKSNNKTRLLIARHGNTFNPGEPVRRVGGRTDLPLVETHKAQALGRYLSAQFKPDVVLAAPLKRTLETASIALNHAGLNKLTIIQDENFKEIDYGPDENQPETAMIQRIGQQALDDWNHKAKVPEGWKVDPDALRHRWRTLGTQLLDRHPNKNILIVTSNGVARFAPALLTKVSHVPKQLKINTGHISLFEYQEKAWVCTFWNQDPARFC